MTKADIQTWQRALGVTPDGDFGPLSLKASMALLPALPPLTELPWIVSMKSVYGLHETRDKTRLQLWLRSDGKTLGDPGALPWCGDAVETAIKNALPDEPFPGDLGKNPYWARNWALFGREAKGYGSVGVFERGSGGHVGFLVGEDTVCYHVLGGNQGDAVNVARLSKDRLLAARWPASWAVPPKMLPKRTSSLPVSVNEV
jgi:uncharacterized protein (TIGR02594 family)